MWYLQDLGSLPLLVYAVFTGSRQPPFLDLHDIYRISTASLFQFTWYLQGLDSPPFSIYVVFTGSRQPPFSIYVVFTMLFTGSRQPPFLIYMVFTGSRQPPLFNLHGIYRISTASLFQFTWYLQDLDSPLFQFTWYLQCYLQDLDSPPFLIYAVFTGSRQPPFLDLHDIYRISTASLFQFTWYLQGFDSPPFSIYVVFTGSSI